MTPEVLLLAVLAAHRLAQAVTTDDVTAGLRRATASRFPPRRVLLPDGRVDVVAHPVVVLVNCGRCTGWWTAGLVVAACSAAGAVDGPVWFAVGWCATAGGQALLVRYAP